MIYIHQCYESSKTNLFTTTIIINNVLIFLWFCLLIFVNFVVCCIAIDCYTKVGSLNWDFGGDNNNLNGNSSVANKVFFRNSTTSYGCESQLTQDYFCQVFDAMDYSQSCANVSFIAYNVKECDNFTIIGYDVSYFEQLMCCNGNTCNYNFTQSQENKTTADAQANQCTTYDETMSQFYSKINSCQASIYAVNSTYGHSQYCSDSSFFDEYQYCEYLSSQSIFEYGCLCESYSIIYNSDNSDDTINLKIENEISLYESLIVSSYESFGYCCDIQFNCDLNNQEASVILSKHIISLDIILNGTIRIIIE